jgi:hypothetical protein
VLILGRETGLPDSCHVAHQGHLRRGCKRCLHLPSARRHSGREHVRLRPDQGKWNGQLDFDLAGRLVGIEVLDARAKLVPELLAAAENITRQGSEE